MRLLVFSSNVKTDLELAYSRGYWSIWTDEWQESTKKRIATRIINLDGSLVGSVGMFYCSDGQFLSMPFVITDLPKLDGQCEEQWTENRKGEFGFTFIPIGHINKQISIMELRELLGNHWNTTLGVAPTDLFTFRDIPHHAGAEILSKLT